jgi:hypothetical protein
VSWLLAVGNDMKSARWVLTTRLYCLYVVGDCERRRAATSTPPTAGAAPPQLGMYRYRGTSSLVG